MKILLTGLPYFTKDLYDKLSRYDKKNRYIILDTYYSFTDKIRFLKHFNNADLIYSINGATSGSRVFDMAIRYKKKLIMHWAGSDVMLAKEAVAKNDYNPEYLEYATHLCVAPWFVDELKEIGVNATLRPICSFEVNSKSIPLPDVFSVFSYIPEGKEEFYGIDNLIFLAKTYPDVKFRISGISRYKDNMPDNIELLGWIDNMEEQYRRSVLCVRLTKHDAVSFFVLEALNNQRYVAFTYNIDPVFHVGDVNDLVSVTGKLIDRFNSGELTENHAGQEYINREYNHEKILSGITEIINNI